MVIITIHTRSEEYCSWCMTWGPRPACPGLVNQSGHPMPVGAPWEGHNNFHHHKSFGDPPTSWTSHLHSSPLWSHRHHSDLSLTSQFNPFQILSVNSNISALVYIKSNLVICLVSFVWISAADLLLCWSQSRSVGMVSNSDASRPDLFHGHLLYEFSHKWKMKWNMKWNETKWN